VRKLKWGLTFVAIFMMARVASFLAVVPAPEPSKAARDARGKALARAHVFLPAAPDIASLDLTRNPTDDLPFPSDEPLTCRFVPEPIKGTTPKFACRLDNGEVVKIKYGRTPEIPAEIGATRLLSALGLAADRVSFVRTLRCVGCPPSPYRVRQVAETLLLAGFFERTLDYGVTRTFHDVAVERKFPATAIEAETIEGWDFTELQWVTPDTGGAGRDEIDALRLIAVLLAHWDNKASNQRLICLDPIEKSQSTSCARPLLMLQDLGATFGPSKANRERWATVPIWEDAARCTVAMHTLPYQGASFKPVQISEAGRSFLAARLQRLQPQQMHDLFAHAGFPPDDDGHGGWVAALTQKIRAIAERPPCPSTV
jgi:hypothetical protein